MTLAHLVAVNARQQPSVKLLHGGIDRLNPAASEVQRGVSRPALQLPLVKKAQTRRQERQQRCRLMRLPRKRSCGPLLIMILQKPRTVILKRQLCSWMGAN